MPRLSPHSVRQTVHNSLTGLLLKECRDLPSAQNELRWLREHAQSITKHDVRGLCPRQVSGWRQRLLSGVQQRCRGVPLQYILGSQPFGELDILCRPGVLIPRPETELMTTLLAVQLRRLNASGTFDSFNKSQKNLRVLDLCTGSGCISLLLHKLLKQLEDTWPVHQTASSHNQRSFRGTTVEILGLDKSEAAVNLAKRNLKHNLSIGALDTEASRDVQFQLADVTEWSDTGNWDVIVSNPPYISEEDYAPGGNTTRSVRRYEPKAALVPPHDTMLFYRHILRIAGDVDARVVVMEVGGTSQALEVSQLAADQGWQDEEHRNGIWCDDGQTTSACSLRSGHKKLSSSGRAVVLWNREMVFD